MRRPDPHPEVLEVLEVHTVTVVDDVDAVTVEANSHVPSVGVVAVLDELRERDVGLADESLAQLSEQRGRHRKVDRAQGIAACLAVGVGVACQSVRSQEPSMNVRQKI